MIMKGKKFFSRTFALVLYITVEKWHVRAEGADIFLDYLSDQSKSMSVLYRTQIS